MFAESFSAAKKRSGRFLHGVQIFGKNVIVFTKICITCIIRYCANDKGTRRDRRKYWQRKISVVLSIF